MKKITPLLLFAFALSAGPSHAEKLPAVWSLSEDVAAPESTYLDKKSGFLFVSQIGKGGGMGKDGDGWISKLTIDGKMVKNKCINIKNDAFSYIPQNRFKC